MFYGVTKTWTENKLVNDTYMFAYESYAFIEFRE